MFLKWGAVWCVRSSAGKVSLQDGFEMIRRTPYTENYRQSVPRKYSALQEEQEEDVFG